jgi:hypothetical protein
LGVSALTFRLIEHPAIMMARRLKFSSKGLVYEK